MESDTYPVARIRAGEGTFNTIVVRHTPVLLEDPLLGFLGELDVVVHYAGGGDGEKSQTNKDAFLFLRNDRGEYADVEYETILGEQRVRIFLWPPDVNDPIGAWQRLVNLGYVLAPEPDPEPPDDDALADALEQFQADNGLIPDGELDGPTADRLELEHTSRTAFKNTAAAAPASAPGDAPGHPDADLLE